MLIAAQPLSAQPDKKETCRVPVLLVAGQSNTDGRVPNQDMPDNLKAYGKANGGHFRWAQWCYGSSGKIQTRDSLNNSLFAPYWPFVAKEDNHDRHGYDTYAYYLLEQEWQRPFYIIKWSLGGTAIHPKASSTGGKHWCAMPEYLAENQSTLRGGKSLLKSFIEELNLCLDGPLAQLKEGYDIKAMLWHQGESDRTQADRYYDNLKAVIAYVRNYLVVRTGQQKYAHLPVICGTFAKGSKQGSEKVVEAMLRLQGEDPNFHVVDASDATLQKDQIHFDAAGAELLGKRMYDILETL